MAFNLFRSILVSLVAGLVFAGCARTHSAPHASDMTDEQKQNMFTEPTQTLTPSSPAVTQPYTVYNLDSATFAVDAKVQSLSARIKIDSTAGSEIVELVGALRADGSVSLIDLAPLPDGKNRLVGEALCADVGVCQKIVLNVYYKVEGKTLKKQFSSDALKADTAAKASALSEAPVVKPSASEKDPTAVHLKDETAGADEQLGDFVGAPRNENLIGKLWSRSATPQLPVAPTSTTPAAVAGTPATQPAKLPPVAEVPSVKPKAGDKSKTPVKPASPVARSPQPSKTAPAKESLMSRWAKAASNYFNLVPPLRNSKPVGKPVAKQVGKPLVTIILPPAKPYVPGKPLIITGPAVIQPSRVSAKPKPVLVAGKPVPKPEEPPVRRPLPVKPQPQPITPVPGKPVAETEPAVVATPAPSPATPPPVPAAPQAAAYPFPPAAIDTSAEPVDQKIAALEVQLAPLMNLRDGGVARGSYGFSANPHSSIVDSTLLPTLPGLIPIRINANAHYGTGMLVSFLENAATYLWNQLGLALFVGDMSLKHGGSYGASSAHNTHRNGLDADIAWLGIAHPLVDSALDHRGRMVTDFDYEKTWRFLSLAGHQELVEDAQKTTAVSRIYMSHHVKDGFCSWAKSRKILDDPENSELMRLVRREEGHVKHFHLSLKCSPHYPLCRNLAGPPPPGPGC